MSGNRQRIPTDPHSDPRLDTSSGCWIWLLGVNSRGYGPHRRFYEALVGPVPADLELDHLCRVRRCCNPEHLEPVSGAENRRRAAAEITHCPRGHEYTPENTYIHKGARECRTCVLARNALYGRTRRRKDRARAR